MRPASIKETKNGYNDENYITPRTLRAALADYSPGGGGSSEGGTTDYNKLENKPSINGVTLSQNKTLKDLGIQPEGAYLTEVPDTYKTKDENDRLYQPKGSYQPAGSYLTEIPEEYLTESEADEAYQPKGNYQETLVSGENIKTVNGQTLLGEGDLTIAGGGGGGLIDSLPVGTMIPYGSPETPDNWLSCNGQAVSRTTYSHLFKVIGTSYGAGDGSTTFNLPDKRGRVSVGYDPDQELFNKVGAHVGANTHTLTVEEMPSHSHLWTYGYGGGSYTSYAAAATGKLLSADATTTTGGGKAHSILQASEVDHWIIKAYPLSNADGYLDPLPVGTIVDYEGEEIPDGFEELEEARESSYLYGHIYGQQINTNSSAAVSIPFSEVRRKGEGIKFNGTKIEIGAGVKRVEMSFLLHGQASSSAVSQVEYGIKKNGTIVYKSVSEHSLSANMTTYLIMPTCEIDVTEGDYLEVIVYAATTFIVNSNYANLSFVRIKEAGNDTVDNFIVNDAQEYSTTEQKIGTWINGKPLYRKVISIPVSSITGAGTMIAHGVSKLDLALPPKCSWYDTQAETWRSMPISYFGSLDWASQVLVRTDGNLYFEIGPSALTRLQTKGRDLYVVMEYTKTTD